MSVKSYKVQIHVAEPIGRVMAVSLWLLLALVAPPGADAFGADQADQQKASKLDISVRFDRTRYTLKLLPTELIYEHYSHFDESYQIPVKECSQAVINKIVDSYVSLEDSYRKDTSPERAKTEYDVVVTPAQGPPFNVSRGSNFGMWLRDMPRVIVNEMVLRAELDCLKGNKK